MIARERRARQLFLTASFDALFLLYSLSVFSSTALVWPDKVAFPLTIGHTNNDV